MSKLKLLLDKWLGVFASIFLIVNAGVIFVAFHIEDLNQEVTFKSAALAQLDTQLMINQALCNEIINLASSNSALAQATLNSLDVTEFDSQDQGAKTAKFHDGKIKYLDYWNEVLGFYRGIYAEKISISNADVTDINSLNSKISWWGMLSFIFSIIVLPINMILTILLTKRVDLLYA